MKTPEELIPDEMPCCEIWRNMFRDVQLDAFKAGAEWAATRMKAESMLYSSVGITRRAMNSCHEQIEFVVANLKEIPK